tara:strand:+ start:1126 stop:1311 length:186 start_codon:yes stop_codon:yes gene_type:complete
MIFPNTETSQKPKRIIWIITKILMGMKIKIWSVRFFTNGNEMKCVRQELRGIIYKKKIKRL